jgi:hypothetical protein
MTWSRGKSAVILPALVAGLVVAGAYPAQGQTSAAWGLRMGFGLQTVVFEDPATDSQTSPAGGFHVGLAVERGLAGPLSAEVDLLFSREGFRGEGAHTGDLVRDVLALPILFRVGTSTRVSLHAAAGAAAKVALRCRVTGVALAGSVGCDDPLVGADWSRFDLAGLVGGGVTFAWGHRTVSSDLLLSWGLLDLNDGLFIPGRARSLSVGVSFALLSSWGSTGAGGAS